MSVGSWQPDNEPTTAENLPIDSALLADFIRYSKQGQLQALESLLSADEVQRYAALMAKEKEEWLTAANAIDSDDLQHLMRFFTLAEKLPGWQADDHSPVIWLGKVLKQRGVGIPRELALWIKDNSDNKYLPHGPLL